ncbi:MAG: hypothetical protein Q9191_002887 [Dirinaria sp. TL-2023a]
MASIETYVVTFNCGRELVKPKVFGQHLFDAWTSTEAPNILIISLQEVAPIGYAFLGGSYLAPYMDRIRDTVNIAAASFGDASYVNILTRNLGMTAIMAFVPQDQVRQINRIETAGVGVGMHEMGNKGAVALRFGYASRDEEEVELSFVAAHLAPMEDALERRNDDWKNIVRGMVFTPSQETALPKSSKSLGSAADESHTPLLPEQPMSGLFTPTSHLIFAGDLNYRTSRIKPSPADYQVFPQPTEESSDARHYSKLLKEDQLSRELRAQKACHGLQEAAVDFPPTYKYSDKARAVAEADSGARWDWASHRWPSWCDRILYLPLPSWMTERNPSIAIKINKYTALPLMATSDHRPVALSLSIPLRPIAPPDRDASGDDVRLSPPFGIDPDWRQKRARARRRELAVGIAAFLGLTWEGRLALLTTIVGAVGGWWVISAIFQT